MTVELDLLLHHARIADVFRLRVFEGWVGIRDGRFVYVEEGAPHESIQAQEKYDLGGRFIAPGMIDAHMHIESSMTTPRRFAEGAMPHGTTTVLADPHEVANVAGEEGVRWMIRAAQGLPLRVLYAIPSCVPATSPEIEWTAPVFDAAVITRLAHEPSVIALGEVMDYRGVLEGHARLAAMVNAAQDANLMIEGHIPTLNGTELSEYLAHGITSDHTLTTPVKIREQISKGVAVMIQAKSCTAENVQAIMELPDRSRILLVTDDVEPSILVRGHLSLILQAAMQAGFPVMEAWASATIRPARYLGLRDLGGIAPGHRADFCVLDALDKFPPSHVYFGGSLVAREGSCLENSTRAVAPASAEAVLPSGLRVEDFRLTNRTTVSQVIANAVVIETETTSLTGLEPVPMRLVNGYPQFNAGDALAMVAVIARNKSSQCIGIVKNLGLHSGAYASSFAHDSHNLLVVGRDAEDMLRAANLVREIGGGIVVVRGHHPIAVMRLPVFGLLSDDTLLNIVRDSQSIDDALRALGVTSRRPFLMLSLLALSVSPNFKFTDKGVIDTERRQLLPAWSLALGGVE